MSQTDGTKHFLNFQCDCHDISIHQGKRCTRNASSNMCSGLQFLILGVLFQLHFFHEVNIEMKTSGSEVNSFLCYTRSFQSCASSLIDQALVHLKAPHRAWTLSGVLLISQFPVSMSQPYTEDAEPLPPVTLM